MGLERSTGTSGFIGARQGRTDSVELRGKETHRGWGASISTPSRPQLPGMMGSGWITKGSYNSPHWESEKRRKGERCWRVRVEWDALLLPELALSRSAILKGKVSANLLNTQMSGVDISSTDSTRLEHLWAVHLKRPIPVAALAQASTSAEEGKPIEYTGYRRSRDRRLRNQAMDASKGICAACDTNYSQTLEGMGMRVLQVHHKKQLGWKSTPKLTKSSDLAVVCANCHMLIHMNPKKALSIDKLRVMLKNQ